VLEWDPKKYQTNLRKHGIAFADVFAVFEDPHALTCEDEEQEEERYITVGMDSFGRLLVVVYLWRGDNIRVISARKANRTEFRQYEKQL